MSTSSEHSPEARVRSWGFTHVFTWTDSPNAYYSPHSHRGLSTHLILKGSLTIAYPDDPDKGKDKKAYGVGERLDVDAGKKHEVWVGPEGCTMVIGE